MMARTAASSRASARRTSSASLVAGRRYLRGLGLTHDDLTNNRVLGLDAEGPKRFPEIFAGLAGPPHPMMQVRAKPGLMHCKKPYSITSSANVSSVGGDLDPQRPGRFEIDHELEPGRLPHRQVAGFVALEDTAGINPALPKGVGHAVAIAHQAAGIGKISPRVHRGYGMACRQFGEKTTFRVEQTVCGHKQSACLLLSQYRERLFHVRDIAGLHNQHSQPRW